jgi:hypothetical protein
MGRRVSFAAFFPSVKRKKAAQKREAHLNIMGNITQAILPK